VHFHSSGFTMSKSIGFEEILAGALRLSSDQVEQLHRALDAATSEEAVLASLDGLIGADRSCPWCTTPGAVKRGRLNGLMRYRCEAPACGKTFNALTGSPLARLHMRGKWVLFAQALLAGDTIERAAERCAIDRTTALRWRHRFLGTSARKAKGATLGGVIEADDMVVRVSRKGSRKPLGREPRRRGGTKEPGGKDHAYVVTAFGRDGGAVMAVFERLPAGAIRYTLSHRLRQGAVIVTDAAKNFMSAVRKMGVRHVRLNIAAGERTRGIFHLQGANNAHGAIRDFLRPYRGVATVHLPLYLELYRLIKREKIRTPSDLLAAIFAGARILHA
jgi:transposase-like protein